MEKEKWTVAYSLDCSGQLCPAPILMTEEKLKELQKNEVLEVIFTDPGAKPDLIAWCEATGNRMLKITQKKEKGFATIRKT